MLRPFVLLIAFQFAGEALTRILGLPIPGPVLGLAFLVLAIGASRRLFAEVEPTADLILRHLSLLFVPAGVGVLDHLGLLREALWPILAVLIGSTFVTLLVTALTFSALAGPMEAAAGDEAPTAR